jgi:hypothetical protein
MRFWQSLSPEQKKEGRNAFLRVAYNRWQRTKDPTIARRILAQIEERGQDIVFNKWIGATLVNDETSTDEQVKDYFMQEGMSKDEAKFYLTQRSKALKDPLHFKLLVYNQPAKDKLIGGLGDYRPDSDFDPVQLAKGIKVEMEHTNDPQVAKEIARDHLTEHSNYYIELEKMEKRLRGGKSR